MDKDNVVVTGLGIVSPIACDITTFWTNCLKGVSNVEHIPDNWKYYSEYRSGIWSPLPKIDFKSYGFTRLDIMQRDPVSLIAMIATNEALQHAKIEIVPFAGQKNQFQLRSIDSNRAGVFIGTGIGGAKTLLENNSCHMLKRITKELKENEVKNDLVSRLLHPAKVNPFAVSMLMQNAVSASIGIRYSLHGQNRTISQACSSGTSAIGSAYRAIKLGEIDLAICGGAEYQFDEYGSLYMGFDVAKTLAVPNDDIGVANRPFDVNRTGFLYSQGGAGILILENEMQAKKRGAEILSRVTGFAETFDAHSMMNINNDGKQIKRMLKKAIHDANLKLSDIDYVNTHGTGTLLNDEIESKIIDELFGKKPLVNSTKSLLGHSIGASGAIEAIVSVLSLKYQTSHRCNNLNLPVRDLNFVTSVKKHIIRNVLTESFAFGGHNSALIFSAAD